MVEFRDGSVRLAVVIERRPHNNDTTKTLYDYYIHYKGVRAATITILGYKRINMVCTVVEQPYG